MPPASAARQSIDSLQAGRAIAALSVVLFHAGIATEGFASPLPHAVSAALGLGYLGVDFFFVLSGFIIHWTSTGKTPAVYAVHRIRRIYLPYLPIGIALGVAYTLIPRPYEWQWLTTLTLLPIMPGPALNIAWTLQHEIAFYAIYGALLFSGWLRVGLIAWVLAIVGLILIGVDAGIVFAPINLEFIVGIVAAELVRRGQAPWWLAPIGLLPVAAWIMLGADRPASPIMGLAIGLLVAPLADADLKGHIRTPRALLFLGAASYSIYLVHNPVVSIFARIAAGWHWQPGLALIIAASVCLGCIYYWCYERRILRRNWRWPVTVNRSD